MPTNRRTLLKGSITAAAAAALPQSAIAKDKPLKGKSVLITGCSSGFGYLGALHYASLGAKVIATMRNMPRPEADTLAAAAKKDKLDIHIVELDVLSDESVAKGVSTAEKIAGGALDILINNAGVGMDGPIELQDMEATELLFGTNVYGVQRVTRAALPAMRAKKSGHIFNISSQLGRVILPSTGHYSPSKFALEALSEALAYELVAHNINVTIIQPGGYPTDIWKKRNGYALALKERADKERKEAYPALVARMGMQNVGGRGADPMDVPRAIAEIALMPTSDIPLRRAVHPRRKPQLPINEVSAKTQTEWLDGSVFGPWIKAVHGES